MREHVVAVAGDEILDHAQEESACERDRDRPQATEHDRGERPEDHQREGEVLELEQRRDENSAEAGENHRHHPCRARRAGRIDSAKPRERLPVDHCAHVEPDSGAADHEPQRDGGERGDHEHRDLVGVEDDVSDLVTHVRGLPDSGHRQTLGDRVVASETKIEHVVPDADHEPLHERRKRDEQSDRADDPRVDRRLRQSPQQDAIQQQTQQGREDERAEDHGRHDRHAEASVELVVEVRRREGDRAMREVEDPRRRVGEHQPRRHDRVDRAGHEAREDQIPELAHCGSESRVGIVAHRGTRPGRPVRVGSRTADLPRGQCRGSVPPRGRTAPSRTRRCARRAGPRIRSVPAPTGSARRGARSRHRRDRTRARRAAAPSAHRRARERARPSARRRSATNPRARLRTGARPQRSRISSTRATSRRSRDRRVGNATRSAR